MFLVFPQYFHNNNLPPPPKVKDKYCFGRLPYVTVFATLSYKHNFSWSYRQILAKSACTCYLDMIKSLESFSDLDLIFKVTISHKLKYLSKIMTLYQTYWTGQWIVFGFTRIYFMGKIMSLLVTLTFLLLSQQDVKCQMQTCFLNCSTITGVAAYDL